MTAKHPQIANRTVRWAVAGAGLLLAGAPLAAQTSPGTNLVWPLPPEPAVIRYTGAVRSDRDIGRRKSLLGRVTSSLLGTSDNAVTVQRPHDVFVDADGRMYVTNGLLPGFWVFDPTDKAARFVEPEADARLAKPMGITGDNQGVIYIADRATQRVVGLTGDGDFVTAYGGPGLLLNPVDVAVSPAGDRIYVADSYLHQIVVFARDGSLLTRIGRDAGDLSAVRARRWSRAHGSGAVAEGERPRAEEANHGSPSDMYENRSAAPGEFRYPAFVAVAPDGSVYVSDGLNFRVQKFDADGAFQVEFGRLGDTPGSFARPKDLAVDADGHVYVVDAAFNNVQIFAPDGALLLSFGGFGNGDGQLWLPIGVTISAGRVFVADRYNNRIQVYEYLGAPDSEVGSSAPRDGIGRN